MEKETGGGMQRSFDTLPRLSKVSRENERVAFGLKLNSKKTVITWLADVIYGIHAGAEKTTPCPATKRVANRKKTDEKLESNPPDAPALTDILEGDA